MVMDVVHYVPLKQDILDLEALHLQRIHEVKYEVTEFELQ